MTYGKIPKSDISMILVSLKLMKGGFNHRFTMY